MRIHVVGIGGTGMSAVARLLVARGHTVSGSDDGRWPLAEALRPLGVVVRDRFAAEHASGAEVVLRSSAYGDDHVEVAAARASRIPVWRRHEAWSHLAEGRRVLAVAGTHGKTTTAAMAWSALAAGGVDASLICGAVVGGLGTNAHAGTSDVLVIEADEYDRTFLALRPTVAIVTNVEHDHVDQFPTLADVAEAFGEFAARTATLVACADDAGAAALVAAGTTLRYGTAPAADARILGLREAAAGAAFTLVALGARTEVALAVPGAHNARNAAAALTAAALLGSPPDAGARGLAAFRGTARRLETLGAAGGVTVVDDYAHHPTEIRAALAALRPRARGRLVALFQPHTPSRLAAFADGFADALGGADLAVVARTFPSAREHDDGGAGARALAARAGARYAATLDEAAALLGSLVRPGDLVAVLGAGDVRLAGERLLADLARVPA